MLKSIKRAVSLLIAFCMVLLLFPLEASADEIIPPERYGKTMLKQDSKYDASELARVYSILAENYLLASDATGTSYYVTLNPEYSTLSSSYSEAYNQAEYIGGVYEYDYPEHFWLTGEVGFYPITDEDSDPKIVMIRKMCLHFDRDLYAEKSGFDFAADELMASLNITAETSEYERAKLIHDKLIELAEYEPDAENASNAYGAIVKKAADSAGYAKAYQYLLHRAGIQAGTVSGTVISSGETRTWNFVRIDGKYYYTDVSADDCGGAASYKYFNVTSAQIETERTITPLAFGKLPICDSTDAAYEEEIKNEHEHEYCEEKEDEKYLKSAVCGEYIVYFKSCACGEASETETFTSLTAAGHVFTQYLYNNDASCEADGTETAKCDRCGETDTKTAAGTKLSHSFEYSYNGDATCLADGTKTPVCKSCGERDETQTVTAEGTKLGHSFTNYVDNDDATCLRDGTETAYCDNEVCSMTDVRTKEGSQKEHSFVKEAVKEPTCTEGGYTFYKCSGEKCAEFYFSDETFPLGHAGGKATCIERAVCDRCKESYGEFAGHDYDTENWIGNDKTGHYHKCKNCPAHTETVPHTPGPEATEASAQVCLECGYILTPVLVHQHRVTEIPANPATCTEPGNIGYYVCSCGRRFVDAYCVIEIVLESSITLEPKGHSFGEYESDKNATCTSDGTETAKCKNCSAVDTRKAENSKLSHDYIPTLVKPSCTEGGYTIFTCKDCQDTYIGNETDPLGHSYESFVTEPSCTADGFTKHICSRCKDEYIDSEIPKLEHEWLDATCTAPRTCKNCSIKTGEPLGHSLSDWEMSSSEHWKVCTKESCQEEVPGTRGIHGDWNYDGACDFCGYDFPEIYSVTTGEKAVLEYVYDKPFLIIANGDYDKFMNVMVDDETVVRLYYTVSPGSTEVRFSSEYLKTLSLGVHTVKFIFADGVATAEFEIKSIGAPPSGAAPIKNYRRIVIAENDYEEVNPSTGAPLLDFAPLCGAKAAAKNS